MKKMLNRLDFFLQETRVNRLKAAQQQEIEQLHNTSYELMAASLLLSKMSEDREHCDIRQPIRQVIPTKSRRDFIGWLLTYRMDVTDRRQVAVTVVGLIVMSACLALLWWSK